MCMCGGGGGRTQRVSESVSIEFSLKVLVCSSPPHRRSAFNDQAEQLTAVQLSEPSERVG